MDASILQARWQVHDIMPEDVPRFAADLLQLGLDTPALRVLAGLQATDRSELASWMQRFFDDTGLGPVPDDEARWKVVYFRAQQIVDGVISPLTGARALSLLANELTLPPELQPFVYFASDYGGGSDDPRIRADWFDNEIISAARRVLAVKSLRDGSAT